MNRERLVATPALRLAPRQRDIDRGIASVRPHDLVDGKALANRLDATDLFQQ